jgi:hypothetical protein
VLLSAQLVKARRLTFVEGSIRDRTRLHDSELHYVFGKCSCFVAEDVVDLTELLVEVVGLDFGAHVLLDAVDVSVPVNAYRLKEVNDFDRHEQADRDHVREQKDPRTKHQKE